MACYRVSFALHTIIIIIITRRREGDKDGRVERRDTDTKERMTAGERRRIRT
jgi:hypothetical protein